MPKTASTQPPANVAPVHMPDRKPTVPTRIRIATEADWRVCANWRSSS